MIKQKFYSEDCTGCDCNEFISELTALWYIGDGVCRRSNALNTNIAVKCDASTGEVLFDKGCDGSYDTFPLSTCEYIPEIQVRYSYIAVGSQSGTPSLD